MPLSCHKPYGLRQIGEKQTGKYVFFLFLYKKLKIWYNIGHDTYYIQNAHGDIVNLTDKDGKVTKSYRYDAFGVEKNIDNHDTNAFRYCGEYFDKETATVYLRARNYNPSTGRFINRDSFAGRRSDPLSLNLYTYCRNNPIRYVDPSGHFFIVDDLIIGLGIAATTSIVFVVANNYITSKNNQSYKESNTTNMLSLSIINTLVPNVVLDSSRLLMQNIKSPFMENHSETKSNFTTYYTSSYNDQDAPVWKRQITYMNNQIMEEYMYNSMQNNINNVIDSCIDNVYHYTNTVYATSLETFNEITNTIMYAKKSKTSGKEKASDIPSWAKGKKPLQGEKGKDFARRLCDDKYGQDNYDKGPGSEYNKLRKYGDKGLN